MSTSLRILIVVLLWAVIVAFGYIVLRRLRQRNDALLRFQRDTAPADDPARDGASFGWLRRQMMLAGFSRPEAGFLLLVISGLMLIVGAACALVFRWSGLQQQVLEGIELVPGGLSGILTPVAILSPWLITLLAAATPLLIVRASRRKRIMEVSRDLPLALDLWATLSEGGMGFDAALDRWQKTQQPGRALADNCRTFQRDLIGGMRRSIAYRRMAERLEVPALSRFTASMIQSEQMGSSVAETLRLQAEDVRAERREKSMTFAQSLATKRVIPLVICFLPGLFVWPLGPFFIQLLRIVDSLTGAGS
ncbi:MAG: type II secretion system F family protein [Rubripirellula sp.]|nr:type II secretion system F family protein [Rubripirellula sp.]